MHTNEEDKISDNIYKEVARIRHLDRAALLRVWFQTFQNPPALKLRKELMVPIIAYRLQEIQFGGLSNTARNRLQHLIAENRSKSSRSAKPSVPEHRFKLIRRWKGEVHEVIVTEDGFIYRGEAYQKLSPIAKRITGTQWSGPAFFGTKQKEASA